VTGRRDLWTPPPARPASTVALLRDSRQGLQVYMVQRAPTMNFPTVTAYPGGGHEPSDGPVGDPGTAERAARRELREETGVDLPAEAVTAMFARWVTPEILPARFDTYFFAAELPVGAEPRLVGTEAVAASWWAPGELLKVYRDRGLTLLPPTLATLAQLAGHTTVHRALSNLAGGVVPTLLPQPVKVESKIRWQVVDVDTGVVVVSADHLSSLAADELG